MSTKDRVVATRPPIGNPPAPSEPSGDERTDHEVERFFHVVRIRAEIEKSSNEDYFLCQTRKLFT
jgi:hypothetical protein